MPRITPERRAARRLQILEAAWECFSVAGFHATTMDDVAAAAGVSAGTTYTYFATKDDLIAATADVAIDMFIGTLQALASPEAAGNPASPADILAALNAEIQRRRAHPRYDLTKIAVQAWAEAARSPAIRDAVRDGQERAAAVVADLVRQWVTATGAPIDPDATARLLSALVPSLTLTAALSEPAGGGNHLVAVPSSELFRESS